MNENEDYKPKSVNECMHRNNWPKWKDAIQAELNSLAKRKYFGRVMHILEDVPPVGYRWVFVHKRNEKGEIVWYKARLVA